jgi:hypothetical protein
MILIDLEREQRDVSILQMIDPSATSNFSKYQPFSA